MRSKRVLASTTLLFLALTLVVLFQNTNAPGTPKLFSLMSYDQYLMPVPTWAAIAQGWAAVSSDCSGPVPRGYKRIFIANRQDGIHGFGLAGNPYDGSTPQKFDTILRNYSESKFANLVVCIGPGTFQTYGTYDWVIDVGHVGGIPLGFTVNKGWKIHGMAMSQTTLQVAAIYSSNVNSAISTYDDFSSGIEVSDLTIDDNYPYFKAHGNGAIELNAVTLRSYLGNHWVHNVHVMNASGELPAPGQPVNPAEAFPVAIVSVSPTNPPSTDNGNIIESVTMDNWEGKNIWQSGHCTAISVSNAVATVRNNSVTGHHIGYGGWIMGATTFSNNTATGDAYGFNIDSLANNGVVIVSNQINPLLYGIVVGGGGQYSNFVISNNTITLSSNGGIGFVFQGDVTHAHLVNNVVNVSGSITGGVGILERETNNDYNLNNIFQGNQFDNSLAFTLMNGAQSCTYGNVNKSNKLVIPNVPGTPCL